MLPSVRVKSRPEVPEVNDEMALIRSHHVFNTYQTKIPMGDNLKGQCWKSVTTPSHGRGGRGAGVFRKSWFSSAVLYRSTLLVRLWEFLGNSPIVNIKVAVFFGALMESTRFFAAAVSNVIPPNWLTEVITRVSVIYFLLIRIACCSQSWIRRGRPDNRRT